MSEAAISYHWTRNEFVRAWEAGVFDHRTELIDGEVWPVVIGSWHGRTVGRIIRALPDEGVEVTTETLPTGDSLPDPDCWVLRSGAEPMASIGSRLSVWAPSDVLLVVEVSDETVTADLGVKARLYGRAGYPVYWVLTHDAVYEHTAPSPSGYRTRREYRTGDRIPVRYTDTELAVDDLVS
jgi:hypothetical protein